MNGHKRGNIFQPKEMGSVFHKLPATIIKTKKRK